MSKSYRKEVLRRLQQELNATTDTKEIIRIGNAIAKLTKKQHTRRGRPTTKTQATPSAKQFSSSVVGKWADRLSHIETEAKLIETAVILEVEDRRKKPGYADMRSVLTQVMGMLSEQERAVLESATEAQRVE